MPSLLPRKTSDADTDADKENRGASSPVRIGRSAGTMRTGALTPYPYSNSPRRQRINCNSDAEPKPRKRRVQWQNETEEVHLIPSHGMGSPGSQGSPRRGTTSSESTKRWMTIVLFIAALGLLRYFVALRQVMNVNSALSEGCGQHKDWLITLPQTLVASMSGGENIQFDASTLVMPIISMKDERLLVREMRQSRAEQRRMRTKPPSTYPTIPLGSVIGEKAKHPPPRLTLDLPSHRELREDASSKTRNKRNSIRRRLQDEEEEQAQPTFCGQQAQEASQNNPQNYPPYASIGPGSRVVVTGALSQVGMEVILQLHEQCGVKYIHGIDSAYPNTRHERMDMVETRYEYLARRVPGFQKLIVPKFGIHPDPHEKNMAEFDVVQRLKPTHIVHLAGMEEGRGEYTDYGDVGEKWTGGGPTSAPTGNRGTMRMLESLLSMNQVLSSLAKDRPEGQEQPQLVYISSNEANDQSGVYLEGGNGNIPSSVYGTSSLLKEVLASSYYRNHGVHSVGIRVPTIFGPFSRPGSVLYDLAERTVRNAAGKDVDRIPSYHFERDRYELSTILSRREGGALGATEQVAYVHDVASAIMSALQFKKDDSSDSIDANSPTLVTIGSEYTARMKDLKERMEKYLPPADQRETAVPAAQPDSDAFINSPAISMYDTERNRDILGWSHTTGIHEGTKAALAWQVSKAYPYGLPKHVPGFASFQSLLDDTRDSLPYHSLPCASGCRFGRRMCSSSPWDEVIDRTKAITKSCQYVLYTVDLHPMLKGMEREPAPSQQHGREDKFCKIAFISSSSKLARTTYPELEEGVPLKKKRNGKGKQGLWTIVAVPGSKDTMNEAERSLAKLTPTMLFNKGVERAMYVNHRRIMVSTDQAINVMWQMDIDARSEPEEYTVYDERLKHNVVEYKPPHPARTSVFFTTRFSFPKRFDLQNAGKLAAIAGAGAGVPRTAGMGRQAEFYQETSNLVRTNSQRSPNYQRFFQDNHFRFDFVRTSWVVHELQSEAGRNLRCEMYEEHSLWGNEGAEDMSIAYVLAKRKLKRQLGQTALDLDEDEHGGELWYPFLVPKEPDDEDAITEGPVYLDYLESAQKVLTDSEDVEYYISFFPHNVK